MTGGRRPGKGLAPRAFQAGAPARRLRERYGSTAVERTDGPGGEEREPGVRDA